MLKGSFALVLRYVLLLGGSALVTAGWLIQSDQMFCFDARTLADQAATAIALLLSGSVSVVGGIGWRFWAKQHGGVT